MDNPTAAVGMNQMYGFSPALDLQDPNIAFPGFSFVETKTTENILLIGASDPRHVFKTVALAGRHPEKQLDLYIMEESMECMAREILLFIILIDDELSVQARMQIFLETYGNLFIRTQTHEYLVKRAKIFSNFIQESGDAKERAVIAEFLDISQLKYKERDQLDACLQDLIRSKSHFDMKALWDLRLRNFYADRYDHRDNMIDWDYTMRGPQDKFGWLHKIHYRRWRNTGLAFELRLADYTVGNRTLGTLREALQKKKGKIQLRGYWGDVAVTPYIGFGIESEAKELYERANKQYKKNTVHVSEFNVMGWLHEWIHGTRYTMIMYDIEEEIRKKELEEIKKREQGLHEDAIVEEVLDEEEACTYPLYIYIYTFTLLNHLLL